MRDIIYYLKSIKYFLKETLVLNIKMGFNEQPILVYQMAKVGSTSVYKTLKSLRLSNPIFFVHSLSQEVLDKTANSYQYPPLHLVHGRIIRHHLDHHKHKVFKWKVITLVRDPIARQASLLFQTADRIFSKDLDQEGRFKDPEKIMSIFRDRLLNYDESSDFACNWFDRELKQNLGIDVFAFPFDKEKGYSIFENHSSEVLVLRCENLGSSMINALKLFLNIKYDIQIIQGNIGLQKNYSTQYGNFLTKLRLPKDLCELIYTSNYVQYFYSQEMIQDLIKKWSEEISGKEITKL
jgi:hypothetical protein